MKVNNTYLFLLLILVALIIGVLVARIPQNNEVPQQHDFEQIEKEGTLHFITDYNSVGYFVTGDTISGFNYDLIQLLKPYTPLKIEIFLETSLNKSINDLRMGKYDVLVRNIPITSKLKDSLAFTQTITQSKQVLVQRKAEYNDDIEPIRSHLALAKKTIYVPEDSPAILRIENLSHEIGDTINYIEDLLYGSEQLIMKVASKEIDYTVCDERIAKSMAETLPEIDYKTLIGFTHLEAWAVRKDAPVLLDSLNQWLGRVKETPEFKSLYWKYYK